MTRFHQHSSRDRDIGTRGARRAGDPLWYKDAVIYQVHVKAFRDSNDDGIGDFPGLTQSLPYIRDLGVNTVWLLPFYPSPLQRRRLRHRRLPRRAPALRHARRLPALPARSPSARPARHHRAGHQPYLGPASVVPGGTAGAARLGQAQLLRVERHRHALARDAHHLHRHREVELGVGPGGQAVLLASLLLAPARPQLRQSRTSCAR